DASGSSCPSATLTDASNVKLNIENLSSAVSEVQNSIGFQTLPAGYTLQGQTFPTAYTLTGSMNIGLTNITLTPSKGIRTVLGSANAASLGKLSTNGSNVNVAYTRVGALAPAITMVANAEGEDRTIAPNTWVEIKGINLAPVGSSRVWASPDFVNNKMPT